MATVQGKHEIQLRVTLSLTEPEARALEALACYGTDDFLKTFYEKMGKSYLEPHEAGLRLLFESINANLPRVLKAADDARKYFEANL